MTLYFALASGNVFLTTLINSQYGLVMDFGLVVLPSWLLLWASPSFRRQLMATFLPITLYGRIYGSSHTTTIKVQTAVVSIKPMQIIPLQKY
jgi:hypothetical protein